MSDNIIKQEKEEVSDSSVSFVKEEPEFENCSGDDNFEDDDESFTNQMPADSSQDPLEHETSLERKRRLGRERKARFRARLSEEALEKVRKKEAEKASRRRATESSEKTAKRRLANRLYQQKRRALETPEQAEARRLSDAISHKKRLQSETPEQAETRRQADLTSHKKRRAKGSDSSQNYDEVYVRISPSGRKEVIGHVDPLDSAYKSDAS